jgi:hypothetical protein
VTNVEVQRRSATEVEVTFQIDEGEPTRVEAVELVGMPVRPADVGRDVGLEELLLLKRGQIYKQADYVASKENLKGYVVRAGYALRRRPGLHRGGSRPAAGRGPAEGRARPAVTFGPTKVVGLKTLPASAVRNRIAWEEGGRYDPRQVERTKGSLYQLGFLSSVRIDVPRAGEPEVAEMTVRAREGLRHELTIGGGVALDNATILVRPRFGYAIKGLWDPLLTLGFDARPGFVVAGQGSAGQLAGDVSATLTRDDLLVPRVKGSAAVVAEVIALETYGARGLRAKIGVQRPFLDDQVQLGLGYQVRLLNFTSVADGITEAPSTCRSSPGARSTRPGSRRMWSSSTRAVVGSPRNRARASRSSASACAPPRRSWSRARSCAPSSTSCST